MEYSADPKQDPDAQRYARITFDQVLEQQLGVMDLAMVLCRENAMPIVVFDLSVEGSLVSISRGEMWALELAPSAERTRTLKSLALIRPTSILWCHMAQLPMIHSRGSN